MTQEFDAGDVVKQKIVFLDDGISYLEINSIMADAGTDLMMQLLSELSELSIASPCGSPQVSTQSSYNPYPDKDDFVVDITGSAQQAFNFMRATEAFGWSYLCHIGNYRYMLDKALDYDNNDYLQDAEVSGNTLNIPCNEGVLVATFTAKL